MEGAAEVRTGEERSDELGERVCGTPAPSADTFVPNVDIADRVAIFNVTNICSFATRFVRRSSYDEAFSWAGVNYLLKITTDCQFLGKIGKLESYLGMRLRKNPLVYFFSVDGTPSNLPGVVNRRKSKKSLPECLLNLDEAVLQECNEVLDQEMSRHGEAYEEDEGKVWSGEKAYLRDIDVRLRNFRT